MLNGMSYEELSNKIFAALNPGDKHERWVRELYADRAIVEEDGGDLYSYPYSVDESGEVTLGEPARVEVEYVRAEVPVALKADGEPPAEIQLIPFGPRETAKGPYVLDEEGAAQIMADWDTRRNDAVIDYEHQTLYGGEAPAAGWIKKLINKGKDGIWGVVEWTDRAKEYLRNREYRYLSPVFFKTLKEGRVIRFGHAALTNTPAIDGMVPLVNKGEFKQQEKEESKMLKKLMALLALKEGTTEEQVMEAVKGLVGDAKQVVAMKAAGLEPEAVIAAATKGAVVMGVAHKEVLDALGLKEGATLPEVKGTIVAMKQGSDKTGDLSVEVKDLRDRLARRDAEEMVAQAMKDGKVTPAQKDWALKYAQEQPEEFKTFVAKASVVVDTRERMGKEIPGGGHMDEVQMSVNKMLGVSEEAFKKHNEEKEGE